MSTDTQVMTAVGLSSMELIRLEIDESTTNIERLVAAIPTFGTYIDQDLTRYFEPVVKAGFMCFIVVYRSNVWPEEARRLLIRDLADNGFHANKSRDMT